MGRAIIGNKRYPVDFWEASKYPAGSVCEGLKGALYLVVTQVSSKRQIYNAYVSLNTGHRAPAKTEARLLRNNEYVGLTNE